ncbi:MAG: hypothetical protein KME45_02905 [Stenomitos rutilans HA7619-LM2]|jgi:hypothetical protein|nr:hypothetical protein [Stenomitos rutilans HA7619-LM2]MBW4469333.1 hypothetical protein [Stenomitos rutilans HA7619-LM2]
MSGFIEVSALVSECSYCGHTANCFDHVIPFAYASGQKRHAKAWRSEKTVIPCCSECNSLLSSYSFYSIAERADFLATRLAVRYRRLLNSPHWSEEDYEDLRGRLKQAIKAKQAEKQVVLERIRHCLFVARLEDLTIADVWIAYRKGVTLAEYVSGKKAKQESL